MEYHQALRPDLCRPLDRRTRIAVEPHQSATRLFLPLRPFRHGQIPRHRTRSGARDADRIDVRRTADTFDKLAFSRHGHGGERGAALCPERIEIFRLGKLRDLFRFHARAAVKEHPTVVLLVRIRRTYAVNRTSVDLLRSAEDASVGILQRGEQPDESGFGEAGPHHKRKRCGIRTPLLRKTIITGALPDDKRRSRYLRGIKEWQVDRYELVDVVMEAQDRFEAQVELQKLRAAGQLYLPADYKED